MKKLNVAITIVIFLILFVGSAFLIRHHSYIDWNDYGGHQLGSGMMGYGEMRIMILVFWGLVLVALILLISRLTKLTQTKSDGSTGGSDAGASLKEPYTGREIEKGGSKAGIKKKIGFAKN